MDLWKYFLCITAFTIPCSPVYGHYCAQDSSNTCYFARDCEDIKALRFVTSGIYRLTPVGVSRGFDVYCDMDIDEGGWTVFQRRQDGSVDFERNWTDYELGFGDLFGEHWLGNLPLYTILYQGHYTLRIDLEDWDGETKYAKYWYFEIGGPSDLYKMTVAGYSGDAGDALSNFSGSAFSTVDRDNDNVANYSCAKTYNGSWWYGACQRANLNGLYLRGHHESYANGVNWFHFRGFYHSLKKTEMKIRRT